MQTKFTELTDSQCGVPTGTIYSRIFTCPTSKKTRSTPDYECHLMDSTQWHNLDSKYPKWQSVYYHFYRWSPNGTLDRINQALNQLVHIQAGKAAFASLICVDSQSVKLDPFIYEWRGLDANIEGPVSQRLEKVLIDSSYQSSFTQVATSLGMATEIAAKPETA